MCRCLGRVTPTASLTLNFWATRVENHTNFKQTSMVKVLEDGSKEFTSGSIQLPNITRTLSSGMTIKWCKSCDICSADMRTINSSRVFFFGGRRETGTDLILEFPNFTSKLEPEVIKKKFLEPPNTGNFQAFNRGAKES